MLPRRSLLLNLLLLLYLLCEDMDEIMCCSLALLQCTFSESSIMQFLSHQIGYKYQESPKLSFFISRNEVNIFQFDFSPSNVFVLI